MRNQRRGLFSHQVGDFNATRSCRTVLETS